MENVSNIQGISRRQSFAPGQNSSEFAFLMSYFFQSRYCQNLGDNSMKQTMMNLLSNSGYFAFFSQIFDNLTRSSLDDLARASQGWGVENIFQSLNITSVNYQLQENLNRLSKNFNVAIQFYGSSNHVFNMTTGGNPKILKIYYKDPLFYACVSNEEDKLLKEIVTIKENVALKENVTQGIKIDLFSALVEGFLKVNDYIRQDDKEKLINLLQNCKSKKELAERAEMLTKILIDCGKCANHEFVCFECKIVHCKNCFLLKYQEKGIKDCFCGKTMSVNFINNILSVSSNQFNTIVPRQASNDFPKKAINPPPRENYAVLNAGANPRYPNTNEETKKIESSNMNPFSSSPPGLGRPPSLPGNNLITNPQNFNNPLGVQNPPGPFQGLPQNMGGVFQGLPQNVPGAFQGLPQNAPGPFQGLLQNTPGPFQGLPQNVPGPFQGLPQNAPGPYQELPPNAFFPGTAAYPQAPSPYVPNQNLMSIRNQCCICFNSYDQVSIPNFCQGQHIHCNNCRSLSSEYCSVCSNWICNLCKNYVLVGHDRYEADGCYNHKACYSSSFK